MVSQVTPYIGAMVQTNYNSLGFNSTTLSNIGVPGGGVHVFSATIDPILHLHPHGAVEHIDEYLRIVPMRKRCAAADIAVAAGQPRQRDRAQHGGVRRHAEIAQGDGHCV